MQNVIDDLVVACRNANKVLIRNDTPETRRAIGINYDAIKSAQGTLPYWIDAHEWEKIGSFTEYLINSGNLVDQILSTNDAPQEILRIQRDLKQEYVELAKKIKFQLDQAHIYEATNAKAS